jgi:cyclopropane fatty-acyl-phospholipid synthase-like methyltransferase
MRILDLGCGKGISSILLAEKYDATVFAADLWITPSENAARFSEQGLDGKIFRYGLMPRKRSRSRMITST